MWGYEESGYHVFYIYFNKDRYENNMFIQVNANRKILKNIVRNAVKQLKCLEEVFKKGIWINNITWQCTALNFR